MNDRQLNREICQYPVRVWEVILIVMAAIGLISVGLVGLVMKALNNAFDSTRAEVIAQSLIDYQIPGGSQGVFGINVGSAKLAWVRSSADPPNVILFVGKTPLNKEGDNNEFNDSLGNTPSSQVDENFTVSTSRIENKQFCGQIVPVTIEQGTQTLSNQPSPLPAIRYIASTTRSDSKQVVILTANGENAKGKAATVFNSLRCK
jgi:hypothetical protein